MRSSRHRDHRTSTSPLVADLNNGVMKQYGKSRRWLFDVLDRSALLPLSQRRFVHGDWSTATVRLDYRVLLEHHAYAVPYLHRYP